MNTCPTSPGGRHIRARSAALAAVWLLVAPMLAQDAPSAPGVVPPGNSVPVRPQPESTRRMVERLAKLRAETRPLDNIFGSAERADLYRQRLGTATDPQQAVEFRHDYALQLLNAGQSEEALGQFDQIESFAAQNRITLPPRQRDMLRLERAVCLLRVGEQENCIANHNAESCLFPIRGGGIHLLPRGSQGAIKLLTELLERRPNDLRARWLLNIAHMTLGQWPDKVPPQWVIPPEKVASGPDFKAFPDVAAPLGLDIKGVAGGVILEDFDGDGFLDVMASSQDLGGQLRFFRNTGTGTFIERTAEAGLTGLTGGLNIQQTDYNNDGRPDVFVLRGAWLGKAGRQPKSLLRNDGGGMFTDVTEEAGLLSPHPTQTAAWFDYDGDGWLDVFIGHESMGTGEAHPCELHRNNRDGTFTECAAACGLNVVAFVKGVASGDFDHDGRPDLYVSCRSEPNLLFRNAGPRGSQEPPTRWAFTNVTAPAGVAGPVQSFATWFFDHDNDGWEDLLVFGYGIKDVGEVAADYLGLPHGGERTKLYRNRRDGTFQDISKEAGLDKVIHAMGSNFGDLDNDGWPDFYAGTGDPDLATLIPNRMFRNDGGKAFQEVTSSGGFGQLQKGHAIAFGDLDNDGDQDIYSVVGGAYTGDIAHNQLFHNPGHGNHWLTLKLEGRKSNRIALGARIKVNTLTAAGPRAIHKTVSTGGSFGSSPLRQEIGLGRATGIASVEVFWPATGQTQTLAGLELDRFYRITEGESQAAPWDVQRLRFDLTPKPHAHPEATARP